MRSLMLAALLACLFAATPARADHPVTIAAAISLRNTLEDARPLLSRAAGGDVQFTFGASGTLRVQIERGAPIDLFISADRANAQRLVAAHLADHPALVAGNRLVLVVPAHPTVALSGFADLPRAHRIALGEPAAVPAGKYARQTLEHFKLYAPLNSANKLVFGENVAQVLTLVDRGEVDAGLVYSSDAKAAGDKVQVVATAPADAHEPIEYELAICTAAPHPAAAARVAAALQTPEFRALLARYGFAPPPEAKKQK